MYSVEFIQFITVSQADQKDECKSLASQQYLKVDNTADFGWSVRIL